MTQPVQHSYPPPVLYGPQSLAAAPAPKPSPLPTEPVRFHQLLRGPRFRWWRPLAAIGLVAVFYGIAFLLMLGLGFIGWAGGLPEDFVDDVSSPWGFGFLTLTLILLIPASIFAIRLAFGVPVGYTASVAGRFRVSWALRCALVVLPLWVALMVVAFVTGEFTGGPHRNMVVLMIMVVVLIPFQAAGEEFFFRGFVQQVLGSWFRNRWLGLIIPGVISIPLFAAAHMSFDPWIFADLAVSATAWVYLTWRTGGLEAGVAVHMVNNCLLMLTSLVLGGFEDGFVSTETSGDWSSLAISAATTAIAVVLISWQARRARIQPLFEPAAVAAPDPVLTASAPTGSDGFGGQSPAQGAYGYVGQWATQQPAADRPVGQPEHDPRPGG